MTGKKHPHYLSHLDPCAMLEDRKPRHFRWGYLHEARVQGSFYPVTAFYTSMAPLPHAVTDILRSGFLLEFDLKELFRVGPDDFDVVETDKVWLLEHSLRDSLLSLK